MSRTIEVDASAVKDYEDNKGGFAPLPAGTYEFTVKSTEEKEAAKSGANANKRILNTQLRVTDDSPTGKGRVFFLRVPLFHKWAPNGNPKFPDGAPARLHFQFYEALGYDVSGGKLPEDRELLGKRITGKIVVKPADDRNDAPYNEVSSVWASKVKDAPAGERTFDVDPWAASAPAAAPAAQPQAAAPAAADPWGVDPADTAFAAAATAGKSF